MIPIETIHCNFTYTAPAGMTAEQCANLPCLRDSSSITSWWRPDAQELATIAGGGAIMLTILGTRMPPVALQVAGESCASPSPEHPAPVLPPLAAKHTGTRVSFSGLITQVLRCLKSKGYRFTLEKFSEHLHETAARYYQGDISAVDEFLQLYCLDSERPKA